jgi:serine protease AprX
MGRYVIYNISEELLQMQYGGKNIKVAAALQMIFADLDQANVDKLIADGFTVKEIRDVSIRPAVIDVIKPDVGPIVPFPGINTYTPEQLFDLVGLTSLRTITNPPLYGKNMNIALIDTGMRASHVALAGHIIFSMDFTGTDPNAGDGYDHGTGTASIITKVAPQAGLINMKVLDAGGYGTEEEVALGIAYCIDMITTKPTLAPSVINLSLGTPDDGDPNGALRVACRAAIAQGIVVIAAVGNGGGGSEPQVMSPACDPEVIAVGSCSPITYNISSFSSQGPTLEGRIKPDCVLFGENVLVASSASDTAMLAKSGTSFSAPMASSMALLAQEGIIRIVKYSGGVPLGLRPQSLGVTITNASLLSKYLPAVTILPTDDPKSPTMKSSTKNNTYGYGLPFGALITQAISPAMNLDFGSIIGFMLVMMIMKMMMGMMANMGGNQQSSKPRIAPKTQILVS